MSRTRIISVITPNGVSVREGNDATSHIKELSGTINKTGHEKDSADFVNEVQRKVIENTKSKLGKE